MDANSIFFSHLCPVKFVPLNPVAGDVRYNFIHMDSDWFRNQVNFWTNKANYFQKWQTNDVISLQCFTGGSTPPQINLITENVDFIAGYTWTPVLTNAVRPPTYMFELNIPLTGLDDGIYYLTSQSGTGASIITEPLDVRDSWPKSLLFQYTNDSNKQSMVFTDGYSPSFRVGGWLDNFVAESTFTTFVDQPADIYMIDGIPYRDHRLQVVDDAGVAPWVIDKLNRIMLLTTVLCDGLQFTRDESQKWQPIDVQGWPLKNYQLTIREAVNDNGVTFDNTGLVSGLNIVYHIDTSGFGDNTNIANVIDITETNG